MEFIKASRIKFSELYQDAINFMRVTYQNLGREFTMASPVGQLLQTTLHLGRMILYYVEDSVTELNILKASRPENVRGIAAITGHNPSRATSARGSVRLTYNGKSVDMYGSTIVIPNYTEILSNRNGLTYTINLSSEEARLNLNSQTNYIDVPVMQGTLEYQQATGTGDPLQSFNFQTKKGASIDNYFVNIFVNGEKWPAKESILDLVYQEKACIVRTGVSGGIDIFFGNGYNGYVPRLGATILVEYLLTDGESGNLDSTPEDSSDTWKFKGSGFSINSEEIDLNKVLKVTINNEIIFGTLDEPLYLTRMLAPQTSRSYALINTTSYIYFLRKLNLFTIVDAIPGFATFEDRFTLDKYNQAQTTYEKLNTEYRSYVSRFGADSPKTIQKKSELDNARKQVYYWQTQLQEQKKDDNTIYLYLVPDINKRIAAAENYYTADIDKFELSQQEKLKILNLIEESGRRCITVDNEILQLKYPRFTLNLSLVIYEGYEFEIIRENIIDTTSDYFLNNKRRDRIPVSDIVRKIENIEGVDSVYVWFDADVNNNQIYTDHYGLDSYGDILLARYVQDAFGNKVPVRDVYPIIRGGFESVKGISYEDSIERGVMGSINMQVRAVSTKDFQDNTDDVVSR